MRLVFTHKDFDIEWFSGTGSGGQHRNKHQNCCRITHRETGIKASGQTERSREENKRIAFSTIRQRLLEHFTPPQERRSNTERVRTYHAERNEVIDHASGKRATYKEVVLDGNIGKMIEARKSHKEGP